MRRIGIFGGSFNPVHLGHVLVARAAKKSLKLDEIIFVPCFQSPNKKKLMPAALRLGMLQTAVKNFSGFSISDVELKRGGISRTIDTLFYFKKRDQTSNFFLIIGEDQAAQFLLWKDALKISRLSKICVITRPGFRKNTFIHKKYHFRAVVIPQYEISSSLVRARLRKNLPISALIHKNNLSILKDFRNIN